MPRVLARFGGQQAAIRTKMHWSVDIQATEIKRIIRTVEPFPTDLRVPRSGGEAIGVRERFAVEGRAAEDVVEQTELEGVPESGVEMVGQDALACHHHRDRGAGLVVTPAFSEGLG